jgi:hypothetical protein
MTIGMIGCLFVTGHLGLLHRALLLSFAVPAFAAVTWRWLLTPEERSVVLRRFGRIEDGTA